VYTCKKFLCNWDFVACFGFEFSGRDMETTRNPLENLVWNQLHSVSPLFKVWDSKYAAYQQSKTLPEREPEPEPEHEYEEHEPEPSPKSKPGSKKEKEEKRRKRKRRERKSKKSSQDIETRSLSRFPSRSYSR
jgi:hypothetical protein